MVGSSARRELAQEGDNQLVVEGVSKRFGGVVAVQDVSLEVPRGSIVSIIGPNGAGKTSLLNMISGFYKPDTGRVVLEGQDITQKKPSDIATLGIARTFQNIALFSGLTVLDNLMLGRHVRMKAGVIASVIYWGMAQKEDIAHREACEEIIDFLKLQDLRKQPTAALAYGLRKRVELGRALALEPRVLYRSPRHDIDLPPGCTTIDWGVLEDPGVLAGPAHTLKPPFIPYCGQVLLVRLME